ncbi:MAG: hypothetical protein AAB438_03130 [Patescibacteria group bacterium]
MIEIKDRLLGFEDLILKGEFKKEALLGVLSKYVKKDLKKSDIKIENNTIFLNIKPIFKNELFLNKEKIQKEISLVLGNKVPKNIR